MCPGSSDPFYVVTYYYVKWVTTSWTYSMVISIYGVYNENWTRITGHSKCVYVRGADE